MRHSRGSEPERVRDRLQTRLGPEMLVLTKKQLVKAEQSYWNGRTPVGFIIPVTLAGAASSRYFSR